MGYAYIYSRGKYIAIHRIITNCPYGMVVDHINGNKLDNRKSNLRFCTRVQNRMNVTKYKNNKSGYKGVYWDKSHNIWRASITYNGRTVGLGRSHDRKYLASLYDMKAKEVFGEYARLNGEL